MQIDEKKLSDYLLGSASPKDEEEISVRLITDDGFADILEHVETDLLERHLDDELSPEEKQLFHDNFMVSDRRRGLLREVEMLRVVAREHTSAPAATGRAVAVRAKKGGFFTIFVRPAFAAAAAAILLVLLAGFTWFFYFRDSRTPLEVEYAAMNQRDLNDPAKTGRLFTLDLIGNSNFRDTAGTAAYKYSALTDPVLFKLNMAAPVSEGAEMSVSIVRPGKSRFVVQNARVFRNQFGFELRFFAPKEALQPGQYEVTVESKNSQRANAPFHFKVQ